MIDSLIGFQSATLVDPPLEGPAASTWPWRTMVISDEWKAAVEAKVRHVETRAVLVDWDGVPVVESVPVESGTVDFKGEASEQWACSVKLSDPLFVPHTATDPLDPRSGLRLQLWWRIWVPELGVWGEQPIGTYDLEDPQITDDGQLELTLTGRDALAQAKRAGYGGQTLSVGGMTVEEALLLLFGTIAPQRPILVYPSSVMLPPVYELGAQSPDKDWRAIADLEYGWVVRTNREGVIICGPPQAPETPVAIWQEGPGCPVVDLDRDVSTSSMINRAVVVSTSPDVVPPIVAVSEDDDEGSSTWVGSYGPYEIKVESDAIATQEAADNLARSLFERLRHPMETVKVKVPPRSDLDYRAVVQLARARAGVAGEYRVSSWKLNLNGGPMEVVMMTRSIQ